MSKAMLIINPSSGKELGKKYAEFAEGTLAQRFATVDVRFTEKELDATEFARTASHEHYDAVVAMGGDGTVNEVITGIAEQDHRPTLGIVPLGTVNDLARALHIPTDARDAISVLEDAPIRPFDIGKYGSHYFMNVIAVGLIADAVEEVSVEQKTSLGSVAYFIEGLKAFKDHSPYPLILRAKEKTFDGETPLLIVSLTNSVGGFESFAKDARVDDGLLHVFLVKQLGFFDALQALPKLLTGDLSNADQIEYFTTTEVEIESDETLSINADGDTADELPITVRVLPQHLNVIAPTS
ncbi:diacylglycerol/lipid kinase family protein [Exiguobacterium oxidotolerans]|uniref:diacylglycerol/lipid kinase family protein n=1 Tax=Exiguobacterium oxidotolerans TaxID=223958 RepID=UPI0004941B3E|nr:diacylglycerol kinase family protein [Exiguobacterium oxidotolerans]